MQREATATETDRPEESQGRKLPRPHYIQEAVGHIAGLDSLRTGYDLREILFSDLETQLKAFAGLDIDLMTYGTLARLAKWVSEIDFKLPRATEAVAKGRVLLVAANLECLLHIIHGTSNKAPFETYLRSL